MVPASDDECGCYTFLYRRVSIRLIETSISILAHNAIIGVERRAMVRQVVATGKAVMYGRRGYPIIIGLFRFSRTMQLFVSKCERWCAR
jgi:hypothetical protein